MFPSPAVPPHCVEQCAVGQAKVSHSAEVFGEIRVLLALMQHHVGMSVLLILHTASLVIAAFPHDSSQLWGERCRSTTLISVTPWPDAISQENTASPGRHLTGMEERFIQVLPSFPWQSVVGPLLFWYDNYCPFRSGHIFSFRHLLLSPKAFLDVQWGRFPNSLRKHLFVGPLLHAKATD